MRGSEKRRGNATGRETEILKETGIERGTGTETEIGTEIGTERGRGIGTEREIGIEALTKLLSAAQRDGGDAPLHHRPPTKGAAGALRNGKISCDRVTLCSVSSKQIVIGTAVHHGGVLTNSGLVL